MVMQVVVVVLVAATHLIIRKALQQIKR